MSLRRSTGSERVLAKLHAAVERGDYYEAHQMYRTLYFRYSSGQRWPELLALLRDGACRLLASGQTESGADLTSLYLDTLKAANLQPDLAAIDSVVDLYSGLGSKSAERPAVLYKIMTWLNTESSAATAAAAAADDDDGGGGGGGPPGQLPAAANAQLVAKLHQLIAHVHWKEGDLIAARAHLLLSRDGAACGQLLVELHQSRGLPLEIDLFVTQAVLQYLAMRRVSEARACFAAYTSHHPLLCHASHPYSLPMLNFVHFLLECADTCNVDHLGALRRVYGACLARDKSFAALLDRVGVEVFGLAPPTRRGRGAGLLDGLLQSLFGDSDSETGGGAGGGGAGAVTMDTADSVARARAPASKVAKLDMSEELD